MPYELLQEPNRDLGACGPPTALAAGCQLKAQQLQAEPEPGPTARDPGRDERFTVELGGAW